MNSGSDNFTMKIIRIAGILICLGLIFLGPEMMAMGADDGGDPHFDDPDFVDSSPGLGLLLLFTVVVVLILLGVGVILGLVACILAAGLVGLGIVSASAVYGLVTKSAAAGFRALFLLCGALAGLTGGVGLAFLWVWFTDQPTVGFTIPIVGGSLGTACGLLVALLFNFGWTRAIELWRKSRADKTASLVSKPAP